MRHPIHYSAYLKLRPHILVTALILIIAGGWHVDTCGTCQADDTATVDAWQSRKQASERLTSELPTPTEAIAKLIADGNVVFDFYDEDKEAYAFAGETTFDFHYEYRCRTRYQITDQPGEQSDSDQADANGSGRALEVTLDYEEVVLKISHRIRLPSRLVGDDFFDQRLVKHEFDHVEISADARLRSLLVRMLTDRNSKVFVPLSQAENDSRDRAAFAKMARKAARDETKKVFEDFVSLIRIRYKELDQITRHGIEPLAPETRQRLLRF